MRGTFRLVKPDEVEATMTVTMTVTNWKLLRDQMRGKWPGCDLATLISELVYQAERTLSAEVKTGMDHDA